MSSIRSRLLLLLLPALLVVIFVVALNGYLTASRRISTFLDAGLAESARVLLLWTLAEPRTGDQVQPENVRRELDELFRLREIEGRPPADAEGGALAIPLDYLLSRPQVIERVTSTPALEAAGFCDAPGYARLRGPDGQLWHVFTSVGGEPQATVCVGQRDEQRRAIVIGMLVPSVRWWLLVLPLAAAVVLVGVRQGLGPLRVLTGELVRRRPGELAPLDGDPPVEVRPLIEALNGLFDRQRVLIEQERRFSAEAAHELRTPLATIRLRAERALAGASAGMSATQAGAAEHRSLGPEGGGAVDDATRSVASLDAQGSTEEATTALRSIIQETVRADRVLSQLLALARLDAADAEGLTLTAMPVLPLLREVLAGQADDAIARGVEITLDVLAEEAQLPDVLVEPVSLTLLMRNLVDNAVRYSPQGARVSVALAPQAGGELLLRISDRGPGISPALRRVVCEPFKRGDRHDESGTGLGLTIARRVAQLHGTQLSIGAGDGGHGLTVSFALRAAC